jgi:hypothetical protein
MTFQTMAQIMHIEADRASPLNAPFLQIFLSPSASLSVTLAAFRRTQIDAVDDQR